MKNQYAGDVGDYGKYGLLRFLSQGGVTIGVNWYLTPDDGGTDGRFTNYLSDQRMRTLDPKLYDALGGIAFREGKTVRMVEESGILGDSLFNGEPLDLNALHWRKRPAARKAWHARALRALDGAELVFADPDNGLTTTVKPTEKDSQKFVLPQEVADYFERGQDVVYYQHRTRQKGAGWLAYKRVMQQRLAGARLLGVTFHKWSSRTYVFVVHEDAYDRYARLVEGFLATDWGTRRIGKSAAFTAEEV